MPQKIEANGKYLHLISTEDLQKYVGGSNAKKRQKARKELDRRGKPHIQEEVAAGEANNG